MAKDSKNHPWFEELTTYLKQGRMDRRDFLRYAGALGVSASAAYATAGLWRPAHAQAAAIRRGGTFKVSAEVMKLAHPSQISWGRQADQLQQLLEPMVIIRDDGVPRPYLLESWQASDDLKTWTLNLRQGVTWNNGDAFTADDVIFTLTQWLDKEVASTMRTLFGPLMNASGIEKVNAHTVRLHLDSPSIGVPFFMFDNRALVMNHRTFEGDILKNPVGTGPYTLEKYLPGERAVFKARQDYWQKGADGKPLPYLDEMHFIDLGSEAAPQMAALRAGEVHFIDLGDVGGVEYWKTLNTVKGIKAIAAPSGYCNVMRMRVDMKPWDDPRVRQAINLCQNRQKILGLGYFGQGILGHDTHIFPKAAAYCKKEIPAYHPEKAKALLAAAGHAGGLQVTMSIPSDVSEIVRFGEILKEDAAPAGFDIKLETMPSSQYWEKWLEVPFGVTAWAHRNLDTQVYNQAYSVDEDGKPVAWNETRWVDKEFNALLKDANATLDVEARRKIMCRLEDIQMTRGSVGISYFANGWYIVRDTVQDLKPDPVRTFIQPQMWLSA